MAEIDLAPCKHGCGTDVEPDDMVCPGCKGEHPHPDPHRRGSAGIIEKSLIIVLILGGLAAGIALIVTKLVVG